MKELTKEMREFIEDLQVWASNWVEEVQQVVVDHLDDLFKDESIRYLAKKHRTEVEKAKKLNANTLLHAYEFGNPVMKFKGSSFSEVLYELCYRRFVKKDTDNK